ncbi:hypothetical protein [Paraferrimonas sp. SM1919]|uniref:hypothetical protein n=1 Tax=Paraferrimonas sp. SM1919 TaxID=2662263 RepID=UPI0013D3CAA4|nr:hypothetical protein [Paraferrimonas sp. SM1919]
MFKQTIETLLAGKVICVTAYEDEFNYLNEPAHLHRVNEYLQQIDRSVTQFELAGAYYCTYQNIDASNEEAISHLFSDVRRHFRPLVEWLDMLLRATGADLPLRGKDKLHFSRLLEAFEQDSSLTEGLRQLTSLVPFKTTKLEVKEQLSHVFKRLEELDYLVRHSQTGNSYYATAKFDLIYLLIEFINDVEQLELEDSPEQQEELQF